MDGDFEIIKGLELELASSEGRKNLERLAKLLSEDFEECGKSGKVFNKTDIINLLGNEEYQKIGFSNFRFTKISDAAVLVKYESDCRAVKAHRSSLWIKTNGDWQMLYHQGTAYA